MAALADLTWNEHLQLTVAFSSSLRPAKEGLGFLSSLQKPVSSSEGSSYS